LAWLKIGSDDRKEYHEKDLLDLKHANRCTIENSIAISDWHN
jgi:hypothetical protein